MNLTEGVLDRAVLLVDNPAEALAFIESHADAITARQDSTVHRSEAVPHANAEVSLAISRACGDDTELRSEKYGSIWNSALAAAKTRQELQQLGYSSGPNFELFMMIGFNATDRVGATEQLYHMAGQQSAE